MPGIRDGGVWKEFKEIHVKESNTWKKVNQVWQRNAGSWRLIWEPTAGLIDNNGNELEFPIILSGTSAKQLYLTAGADFQAEVVMWGSGAFQTGGYSYGVVQFKKDHKYLLRVNYGGGSGGNGAGGLPGGSGGGYAGLFEGSTTSVSATQTQALLIAGGAGGGSGYGTGAGAGGGGTGTDGFDGGGTYNGGKGFKGSQSAGGSGGYRSILANYQTSTVGGNGFALGGGNGGQAGSSYQSAQPYGPGNIIYQGSDGGGGGGGGYYGGGGGGGGSSFVSGINYPWGTDTGYSGGGGGGSGYVNTSKVLTPRGTGGFGGSSDPDRGGAGSFSAATKGSENNARVVIRAL